MNMGPAFLRGCVPPLLEVALHVGSPSLSMLCIMSPCYTLQLYQVVSPSLTLPPIWLHAPPISTSVSVQTGLCPALLFSFLFLCMGLYLSFSNLTSSSPWLFELFSTSGPSLLTMTTFDSHMSYLGEHIGRKLVFWETLVIFRREKPLCFFQNNSSLSWSYIWFPLLWSL